LPPGSRRGRTTGAIDQLGTIGTNCCSSRRKRWSASPIASIAS
jgi:hypothetical protein